MKLKTFLYTFSLGCCSMVYLNVCFANGANETDYINNSEKKNITSQKDVLFASTENDKNSIKNFLIKFKSSKEVKQSTSETANPVAPAPTESRVLSYGDNFSFKLGATSTWLVKNVTTQATLGSGTGSISNFNFPIPGDYIVEITEIISCNPGQCEHGHEPTQISIYVSPHKMTFNFNSIQFSEPILGGQDYTNLQISLEVNYENYYNQNAVLSNYTVRSAGIETNFEGIMGSSFQNLSSGINEVIYTVSGKAKKDSYIMFDFVDINNQVVSYYYPTKIN